MFCIPKSHLRPIILALILVAVVCTSCETGPDLTNINKAPTPDPQASPPEQELSGLYKLSGTNENGGAAYDGMLTIANEKDGYKFSWQTARQKYNGVGVQFGDVVAATFSEWSDGAGCGVALYRIGPDGLLNGRIATFGEYTFGTERAERLEGNSFAGKYNVRGTTNYGKAYDGTIDVKKDGMGYGFTWKTGATSVGFGIWKGDHAAIGTGGPECSFAVYKIEGDGDLDGRRGSQRSVAFAFETADRQ